MIDAYLGLGSNLAQPQQQIGKAIESISMLPDTQLLQYSSNYLSLAVDGSEQPHFLNAAAHIQTTLSPQQLLNECQCIEQRQQRIHYYHWGPRTIDIDILLYHTLIVTTKQLELPHKELTKRDFALLPLIELNPELKLPGGQPLSSYLKHCPKNVLSCHKVNLSQHA